MKYESQNDYLMHYRTKGSKNGIRRYQNEDGSLTAEGRDHYGVGDPRRVGGLHDKQGNKVSVGANIKAGYKNTKGVAKAAFKMLFKKKNNSPAAGGISAKQTDSSASDTQPQKPKKMNKQQKVRKAYNTMGKVLKIGAGVAVATALAYAGSKHIKNKANNLLDKEHNRNVRSVMAQHDLLSRTIRNGGYDTNTVNYNLNRQRKITNANLEAYDRSRDNQRNKNNRSTREAMKYIRSHR